MRRQPVPDTGEGSGRRDAGRLTDVQKTSLGKIDAVDVQPRADGRRDDRAHRPLGSLAGRIGRDAGTRHPGQPLAFFPQEGREAPVPDREHPAGVVIGPIRPLFLGLQPQHATSRFVQGDHVTRLTGGGVEQPQHHVGAGLGLARQQRRERIHRVDQDIGKAEHHVGIPNERHGLRQRERWPPGQTCLQIGKVHAQPAAVAIVVGNVALARARDEEHLLRTGQPHPLQQVLRHRLGLAVGAFAGVLEAHWHQLLAEG